MKLQIMFLCLFLVGLVTFILHRKRGKTRSFVRQNTENLSVNDLSDDQDDWGVTPCVQSTHFIVIRLMAPADTYYVGYELMQALLSAGLRYGSRNIFHYYEESEESEKILFSLASAVEPGTFELSQMGSITCPGLTLFMEYSKNSKINPLHTLTLMLDTARQLSEDLGGQLLTDKLKPLTEYDIRQWRMQFESYEQSKDMGDLLAAV